jgi:dolichyl-phosphate beta-glucosyltransferase
MISIIIAAYNEEKRIRQSLLKVKEYLTALDMDYKIIVVDDGSTDYTSKVVTDLTPDIPHLKVIRYETNMGKGYALRKGVLASKGEIVLLTDADLSTPIEELSRLLPLIYDNTCDIAIGSRALALSKIIKKQPWWRQSMGKLFNKIVKIVVLDDFNDTQCGFKMFSGDIARGLFNKARINRFAYDVEILALAKKKGYRISEVPIRWINSPESKVNPIRDSLQMLFDLLRIRFIVGSARSKPR